MRESSDITLLPGYLDGTFAVARPGLFLLFSRAFYLKVSKTIRILHNLVRTVP